MIMWTLLPFATMPFIGRLWVGTENGLCRYDHASNTFIRYLWPYIVPVASAGNLYNIFSLAEDEHHTIWIGTKGGLIQYDFSSGKFILYGVVEPTLLGNFRSNRINCLVADQRGHIWIGTQNGCNCFTTSTKNLPFLSQWQEILTALAVTGYRLLM